MTLSDTCADCGFRWSTVGLPEIAQRLPAATDSFAQILTEAGPIVTTRPSSERWSILEYGAHVRDVLLSLRERAITAVIVDLPTGTPIYRDQRVDLGFYRNDHPAQTAAELAAAAELFTRTYASLPSGAEHRESVFSAATPEPVTVLWLGAQALHECQHHLGDVRANLATFGV